MSTQEQVTPTRVYTPELWDSMDDEERAEMWSLAAPHEIRHYFQCRRNGTSHKLSMMLAQRAFPGIRTDSTWNAGRCNGNQFEHAPELGDYYKAEADAAGVSVTGKFYCGQLARFPGDPEAWVGGKGDVARVCRERGYTCPEANVFEARNEPAELRHDYVDPSLIQAEAEDLVESNPGMRLEDAVEKVTELRTGRIESPLVVTDPPPGDDIHFS